MNDAFFSHSFFFRILKGSKFSYTDNRAGSPSHYFAYMLNGSCKITTKTQTVHINEHEIFYIPDKVSYQSYWYGNPKIEFISLSFLCMPNFDNLKYPVQVIPHNEKALKLMKRLSTIGRPQTAEDIGVFYTLAGILIPLMTHTDVCRTRELTEKAREYLIKNPYAKTAEIAKFCAVSESALYAAFQKSSDVTLNQLRNNLLLEKAKDILVTTDKPIEQVSDYMQFSSTSYFRKNFKRYFGITPTEMRKKYKI